MRKDPLRIRLEPDSAFRGVGMLAFGGVMVAIFLVAMPYWLSVDNGEPYGRREIARGLNIPRATLDEVGVLLMRWGRGDPPLG